MKFFALLSAGSMIYFLVHILDCYVCAETGQFGLHRQPRSMSRQAQFVEHSNHFLDVPKIEGIALPSDTDCLLRCMRNDHCFSLNVAAFSLPNGSTWCDLLSTDKYNASDKFKEDRTSHHFSIMVSNAPAINVPVLILLPRSSSFFLDSFLFPLFLLLLPVHKPIFFLFSFFLFTYCFHAVEMFYSRSKFGRVFLFTKHLKYLWVKEELFKVISSGLW